MISRLFGPPPLLRWSFPAMGTQVSVTLALQRRRDRTRAEAAVAEIGRFLVAFGRQWWAWGPGALSQLNRRLEAGEAVDIPEEMRALFTAAWSMRQITGGLFEPRIAALVRLWGFDDIARLRSEPPPAAEIEHCRAALQAAPPYDGSGRYGPAPGIGWDFGGIAKGYVVDLVLERLRQQGFGNATVDAGGNLAVRGRRHERPWHIGIRRPLEPGEDPDNPPLLATVDAGDESVNTHGDDQRFFIFEGRRYAHILHPATGRPVHGLRSLTVLHHDGAVAEAGGAALFVSGAQQWPALAPRLGIHQVLAVAEDGRVTATPALATRLTPQPGVSIQVIA